MSEKPEYGCSKQFGYRVETRDTEFMLARPNQLADGPIGPEWREVTFVTGPNPTGVPTADTDRRLLGYESALALAWTILAQLGWQGRGVECRLVRYRLETSYILHRVGVMDMETIRHWDGEEVAVVKEEAEALKEAPNG